MLSVWPARLTVRTQDSQSCNTGSIPVRATTVRHASVSASVRLGMPTCFGETSARLALAPPAKSSKNAIGTEMHHLPSLRK